MNASTSGRCLLAALLVLAGCAKRQSSEQDAGDDSSDDSSDDGTQDAGEDESGDAGDADVAATPTCSEVAPDECSNVEGCVAVFGSEVVVEDSGAQYCGDLGFAIGCADDDCEPLEYAIICTPDDPPEMFLAIRQCLPEGWSLCPNQQCG